MVLSIIPILDVSKRQEYAESPHIPMINIGMALTFIGTMVAPRKCGQAVANLLISQDFSLME